MLLVYTRLFRGYLSLVDVTGSRSLGCVACVLYIFKSQATQPRGRLLVTSTKDRYPLKRNIQDTEATLSLVDVTGSRSLGCVACVLYMFPSFQRVPILGGCYWYLVLYMFPSFQRVPILGGCYWWPFSWLCCLCLVYFLSFQRVPILGGCYW